MRIKSKRLPIDIVLCIILSLIIIPIALLNIEGTIRFVLGLPFILFIPGYVLTFALFPTRKKEKNGMDIIERIALSFGLSIAIVPLIGMGLNYINGGIKLEPILFTLFIFIIGIGTIGTYRWIKTDPDKRFNISIGISLPKFQNKLDKVLTIILIIVMIIAALSFIYVLAVPKTREKFTEFYWLGSGGEAGKYKRNLDVGEDATVIIGIANHEYRTVNYTVEVWIINQTIINNESVNDNDTIYENMWFMDKINITLNHSSSGIDESWKPQWEHNYTFNIGKRGEFILEFLLFTEPTEKYLHNHDYKDIAEKKISSAYREIHLNLNIK